MKDRTTEQLWWRLHTSDCRASCHNCVHLFATSSVDYLCTGRHSCSHTNTFSHSRHSPTHSIIHIILYDTTNTHQTCSTVQV